MMPKIYLSIDNCFASKRWTEPEDWIGVVQQLGLNYVSASADNECDPLYTTPEYIKDWIAKLKRASEKTGVTVSQFFSGHGTYATLGLCHPDERIRENILEGWLKPMCEIAGAFDANLGFFTHGLSVKTLECEVAYDEMMSLLEEYLTKIALWSDTFGCKTVSLEQMYSPHQPPWTLSGAEALLQNVFSAAGKPLYLTVDVGHQVGQNKFSYPDIGKIIKNLNSEMQYKATEKLWLGSKYADQLYQKALENPEHQESVLIELQEEMDRHKHCFSYDEKDGDTYYWLERFGCYSPIIHLQQTDGISSKHLGFTPENNKYGKIEGMQVLRALLKSYQQEVNICMPPRIEDIYLTLEIFSKTNDRPDEIIRRLKYSVDYWRQFIPEDGIELDELVVAVDD